MDHTTNLLGALALAVQDRIETGLRSQLNRSGEAAAAIVWLGYTPGMSVEALRQVLRLSHPGTVRLIDRLTEDRHVERRQTEDGRAVALHLTPRGKKLRDRLLQQRLDLLESALSDLAEDERRVFGDLMARVLAQLPTTELDKHHICRLCAVPVCSDHCPIPGNAPILDPYRADRQS